MVQIRRVPEPFVVSSLICANRGDILSIPDEFCDRFERRHAIIQKGIVDPFVIRDI
jgi:hypothetical protein